MDIWIASKLLRVKSRNITNNKLHLNNKSLEKKKNFYFMSLEI